MAIKGLVIFFLCLAYSIAMFWVAKLSLRFVESDSSKYNSNQNNYSSQNPNSDASPTDHYRKAVLMMRLKRRRHGRRDYPGSDQDDADDFSSSCDTIAEQEENSSTTNNNDVDLLSSSAASSSVLNGQYSSLRQNTDLASLRLL